MITSNDLFDIYYSLVLIRNDIRYDLNSKILHEIISVVLKNTYEDNAIRNNLRNITDLDDIKWKFVFHSNFYTYRELIKDSSVLNIIVNMCSFACKLLEEQKLDQAYDFIDSVHNIPLIVQKNMQISRYTINRLTRAYRKKWGNCTIKFNNYLFDANK